LAVPSEQRTSRTPIDETPRANVSTRAAVPFRRDNRKHQSLVDEQIRVGGATIRSHAPPFNGDRRR
ncbi:unnamed protein product, partial [Brassica rapa subsp. trilocularis]